MSAVAAVDLFICICICHSDSLVFLSFEMLYFVSIVFVIVAVCHWCICRCGVKTVSAEAAAVVSSRSLDHGHSYLQCHHQHCHHCHNHHHYNSLPSASHSTAGWPYSLYLYLYQYTSCSVSIWSDGLEQSGEEIKERHGEEGGGGWGGRRHSWGYLLSQSWSSFCLDPDLDLTDPDLDPFLPSNHLKLHWLLLKVMVRRDEGVVLPQRGSLNTLSLRGPESQIQPISLRLTPASLQEGWSGAWLLLRERLQLQGVQGANSHKQGGEGGGEGGYGGAEHLASLHLARLGKFSDFVCGLFLGFSSPFTERGQE